jgi:hypothetical protein
MKVYSIDVKIAATAYIAAATEEEAREHFAANFAHYMDDSLITGGIIQDTSYATLATFPDEGRGNVSLSPAITYYGHWGDPATAPALELVYDSEDSSDASS